MYSQLTIVTGPPGVDIGHAVAAVGRSLDDGLAVRVLDPDRLGLHPHTSPDPYHRHTLTEADGCDGTAADPCSMNRVRLSYLPSAWQDPQTNLGVVFVRGARPVGDDVHTLGALGLDPSHRLTIQTGASVLHRGYTYALPIEVGDVGVHARDAVLRAGGHVLIEAGDGMTHLEALAALRLPPWAPWIGNLTLWTVFDISAMRRDTSPGEQFDPVARVLDQLTMLGANAADGITSRVVILDTEDVTDDEYDRIARKLVEASSGVNSVHIGLSHTP